MPYNRIIKQIELETLKELVSLISKQKVKQIEIITESNDVSQKSIQLFQGIKNGKFLTDEDAALALYSDSINNPSYNKLKYRLKQRLLNTIFFIDVQSYSKSAYEKGYLKAYKNWAASRILQDKGFYKPSIEILENVLNLSLKYNLIEISMLTLKDLKMRFGLFNYNKYKYEKYSKLYKKVESEFSLLTKSEDHYTRLGHLILSSKTYKYSKEVKLAELEIMVLLKTVDPIDSFHIKYFLYNAAYFLFIIKKDIKSQYEISLKACEYFKEKKEFKKIGIFSFTQKKGLTLLGMREYNKAVLAFQECLDLNLTKGHVSWLNIHYYIFTANIITYKYQDSYDILSKIMNHKSFDNLNEAYREPWYLKEAFINFLIRIGKIDPSKSNEQKLRPFRLGRFMNEIPLFAKDKRGLNITINIIQMLFLIIEEKYDDVLDKLSALRQYNFRYLKRPEYSRSSNFIKMLLKIPEGNYDPMEIRKKSKKYYDELLANPSDYSEHALSIEIIPYEQLWEEIMSVFERPRNQTEGSW